MAKRSVKKKKKLDELRESMKQQETPKKSEEEKKQEQLGEEIIQKQKEEEEEKIEKTLLVKDKRKIKEPARESENVTKEQIKKAIKKVKENKEKEGPVEKEIISEGPGDGKSIKQQQMEELMEQRKFDLCPFCGQHAMQGAVQPRVPLPMGDKVVVLAMPLLSCTKCTTTYMPRSFMNQLLNPQAVEKPKIITLE